MAHIFLDESGDLGFSKGSSEWFLFTILLTKKHRRVEKVVKKVHKGLRKKYKNVGELHAYHSDDITKKRMLKKLSELEDVNILCVLLNKKKVYLDLQNQNNYLYNYTANIILDRLHNKDIVSENEVIKLCIDQKYTNKFIEDNFENYLTKKLDGWKNDNITMLVKPSHTEKCLQAVDFISWAIFRKYERGDYEFYDIIKDKIIEERLLFP
ncbi:MAG: DUF3800 domain-containing protein [Candidatus Magasanikbacteria bacterium]